MSHGRNRSTRLLSLALALVGAVGLAACGGGENFGAEEGHGLPEQVPPEVTIVNGTSRTIDIVEIYDANAAEIFYVDVNIPPGFEQPLAGFVVSTYDFHVWLSNGARVARAVTVYTDGTARGVQTRNHARVYPGEDADIEFYGS